MAEPEEAAEEAAEERLWLRIEEPPDYPVTQRQEEVIRAFSERLGFVSLAGFNAWMRSVGWDYYDVLYSESPPA